MADLTSDRLQELRRIAETATPGPWAVNPFKALVVEMATLTPVCAMLWPTELRTEEQTLSNAQHIAAVDPTTCLALLDRIEELERENGELYRRIERLEAKLARQRVVLRRLQVAVERRNSQERIEAMRRALYDETVDRYMREYDAAADEAERWHHQYEALRARVGAVADQFGQRATDAWEAWLLHIDLDAQYAARVWEEAEQMVRRLLAEEGGGSQ